MERGENKETPKIEGGQFNLQNVSGHNQIFGSNGTINIYNHVQPPSPKIDAPTVPHLPFEPTLIDIPEGEFLMGSKTSSAFPIEEQPQSVQFLPAFQISQFPITNHEYAEFLKQVKHHPPKHWFGAIPPKGFEDHPVVNVNWYDANTYCDWLSNITKRSYHLPTEAEWEKAARGENGRIYPWGNEWEDSYCNHFNAGTSAKSDYAIGASFFGCQDMVGNVREWTSTAWGKTLLQSDFLNPYHNKDGRESLDEKLIYRIIRGSDYSENHKYHRTARRTRSNANEYSPYIGFRIARTIHKNNPIIS